MNERPPAFDLARYDIVTFLRECWQQKPFLIRNPWRSWSNPLDPDELAGLACEAGVESRLVIHEAGRLAVEHGPLPDDRFGRLGAAPWTLLVQTVDHHVPAVADLLTSFRFIPNWRIDDVMVSYAVDGGGVGAHYDQYDVFLVQGLGRRRWQVGGPCDTQTPLLPHDDLSLLADFTPAEEWVLEPGDILYLPPRIAHRGVALGDDCMTYSIGFRAPSRAELLAGWSEYLLDRLADDDRFTDGALAAQVNPGEIRDDALTRLHGMVTELLVDRAAFARWFGCHATSAKSEAIDWRPETPTQADEVRRYLEERVPIMRNPASRFAFVSHDDGTLSLFVDGKGYECAGAAAAFAQDLCAHPQFAPERSYARSEPVRRLVKELLDTGSIAFSMDL